MKVQPYKIAVLVVAAGASNRMGRPKQLLPWGTQNLLQHAIATANTVSEHVFVVLGAHYAIIAPTISRTEIVYNPNWKDGMGSSIAAGATVITKDLSFSHILVMLADQPLLDNLYFNGMTKHVTESAEGIVATSYTHKSGVPAIFGRHYFDDLKKLDKDYGARKILERYARNIIKISPEDKAVDIDTFEVYQQLKPKNG